jgi:hypothetical protein
MCDNTLAECVIERFAYGVREQERVVSATCRPWKSLAAD